MVTQLSSARLCNQLNLMQSNLYSFMHQIGSSIRALSWQNFNCTIHLENDLPLVEIDPQLLKQAIVNIIKNAYEAMDCCGSAMINVSESDGMVHIAITDYGGGLDPSLEENIFDSFITSKTGGSGLGLVITKQIVEAHHGTLSCSSRPGDGCTFTISIPPTQN
jgi:signal transduction histidine kinase